MKRLALVAVVAVLALAGCTNEPLADQYSQGSEGGYISGDGTITEIPVDERTAPIEFAGHDDSGTEISHTDFAGQVFVVNFWYAGCPPCRLEAPDLVDLSAEYTEVPFLGVNISDSPEVAQIFESKFGIEYPSILDAKTNSVQLAFAGAGAVAPNAVPTTLVIDREGRVAARISGLIADPGILASMIDTVVAEGD